MGRFFRSTFAVVGVIALLMCRLEMAGALEAPAGERTAALWVCLGGELFSLAFILLLQKPFFAAAAAAKPAVDRPLRAMAVLFGLLQLYPAATAVWVGACEREGFGPGLIAVGAAIGLTGGAFVFGGLRGLLRAAPAPESFVDG